MKKVRRYAPFFKKDGKWVRATWADGEPKPALRLDRARIVYQDWLLAYPLGGVSEERELRPVKKEQHGQTM